MKLKLDEARRLTGPNLLWEKPGAVVDVFIDGVDKKTVARSWQRWVRKCLVEFGWHDQQSIYRLHCEGANLAISAPMDGLYAACDIAELAWECCASELPQQEIPDWKARLKEIKVERDVEANPQLMELMAAAQFHQVTCLVDDDEMSLGMGSHADVWPVSRLPLVEEVNWVRYSDIPLALITGTNGKSTSVRLASEIATRAGYVAGVTSTDFIRVGDVIIDKGDYSGPGGARTLLRDRNTEMAFLEVARGGMLRRGLPVDRVDAAMVTNIASDHLGQYGINTVEELAEAKFVVARALDQKGVLVVNADDELVVNRAAKVNRSLCWFSLHETNPHIQQQIEEGGRAVYVSEGRVVYRYDGIYEDVCWVKDIAMTFDGTASHNVQNALAVVGLCRALQISFDAIRDGLKNFGSNAEDNPGRGNIYSVNGCKVIVDFAHNEHSMRAVVDMVRHMPAKKRIAMFSHAGDRSDKDIQDLTDAVAGLEAEFYIAAELEDYLRGRELGDIPQLIKRHLQDCGVEETQFKIAADPLEGAKLAVSLAEPGDVILLFVLDNREQVHEWLDKQNQ